MRMPRIFLAALMIAVVGAAAFGCGGTTGISQADYQALQSKLDAAQQSLTDSQAQVTKLQQDLSDAQAETAKLQAQLADAASGQIDPVKYDALQQQYQASRDQVDSLSAQLADLTDSYNATRAQMDGYVSQIADLQQQIQELSATPTPTPTETPLPLTAANVKTVLWNRINQERNAAGYGSLEPGYNLVKFSDQHVQQMAAAKHTTIYTDSQVGIQAAYQAIGYLSVYELVDATILYWKISPTWYASVILAPNVTYGSLSVLESGSAFYISFMASNYP